MHRVGQEMDHQFECIMYTCEAGTCSRHLVGSMLFVEFVASAAESRDTSAFQLVHVVSDVALAPWYAGFCLDHETVPSILQWEGWLQAFEAGMIIEGYT